MYVLRAHLRTGQIFENNFEDVATGTAALEAVTRARTSGTPVQVLDDAGRQHRFAGTDLLAESLIDVVAESASVLRLGVTIEEAVKAEKQRLGMFEQPPVPAAQTRMHFDPFVGSELLPPAPEPGRYERSDPRRHAAFSS